MVMVSLKKQSAIGHFQDLLYISNGEAKDSACIMIFLLLMAHQFVMLITSFSNMCKDAAINLHNILS